MKEIPLTQGKVAIVDDEDYEHINQWKWQFRKGYAKRGVRVPGRKCGTTLHMARIIMDAPPELHVDHVNGDKLDNRRSNLRLCTPRENCRNRPKNKFGYSQYKEVTLYRDKVRWVANLYCGPTKCKYLGLYDTEEAAAQAYDKAALEEYGEFACLNFPSSEQNKKSEN